MKTNYFLLIVFFISNLFYSFLFAEQKIYSTVQINSNSHPPNIDGLLDDPIWESAAWADDFIQMEPVDGAAPSQVTQFKILYDKDNLYIAIHAQDSTQEAISQRATRRDGTLEADVVGILIDSYFDKRTSFEFYVTAANVKHDRIVVNNNSDDANSNWDPVWYVQTSKQSDGWIAEMRIPFTQLRYGNQNEMIWGLQLARFLHRKQEWSYWKHIPRDSPGWVNFFGELHGIKDIRDSHQIELLPYAVADYQTLKKETGNPFRTGRSNRFSGGIDGKIGVTSNLTLDFTVNPDFGQVEADPSEVNLTAFETRFDERRPFFIEGQNILNFHLPGSSDMENTDLFYSRRIGRLPHYYPSLNKNEYADFPDQTSILGAFKLTGRTNNGISIGVLNAVTVEEKADIALNQNDRGEITVEPLTNYFVGRMQKEYNQGTTIIGGVATATNRNLKDEHLNFLNEAAYTGGFNFTHQWKERTYYTTFFTAFSHLRGSKEAISAAQTASTRYFHRPDASHLSFDSNRTSLSGHGGSFSIGRGGNGHWLYNLRLNWRSPGFELNDIGYLMHADLIQEKAWISYRFLNPVGIFRNLNFASEQLARWNFNGDYLFNEAYVQTEGQFNNYWGFYVRAYIRAKQLSTTGLRGGPAVKIESSHNMGYNFHTDQRKKLHFSLEGSNFWLHDNFSQNHSIGLGASWQPRNIISFSLNPSYFFSHSNLQWVTALDHQNDTRYIFARIKYNQVRLVFRLNYNITPNFTIQYYGQPFIAAGNYSHFKKITNPRAEKYEDRFHNYAANEIEYNEVQRLYQIDENQNQTIDYEFGNPDFNTKQFRSNLVVRWEYTPGSTFYLVWSQDRSGSVANGDFNIMDNLNDLSNIYPQNIFLIKISHWFSY